MPILIKMQLPPALYTAFFVVVLLLLSSPASSQAPGGSDDEKLLKLAMFWPTSLCNGQTNCENSPPARFSIHGLQPLYRVEPCNTDPVDWANFPPNIEAWLEQEWASYGSISNQQFWDRQWDKHGRCSGLLPASYFFVALLLFDAVNLTARLRAEQQGKYFPDGQTVETEDFRKVISGLADEKYVILLCNKDGLGVAQLYEIDICVDDASNAVDCPKPNPNLRSRLCHGKIRLTQPAIVPSPAPLPSLFPYPNRLTRSLISS